MKRLGENTKKLMGGLSVLKDKLTMTRSKVYLALVSMMTTGMTTVSAKGAAGADAKWDSVIDFLTPWISRMGGLIVLIGAIEFGLAFKSDDAEGKTRGIRTIIAGCIVFAVGLSTDTFL